MAGRGDRFGDPARPARPAVSRPAAHGPVSVLVAVALALLVVGAVVLAAVHLVPSAVSLAPDATSAAPAVPADLEALPEPVARATVVATASCVVPGARDTVAVDVAGTRRELPVESCGNRVGSVLDVEVPPNGAVRVHGTGATSSATTDEGGQVSGPTTRIAVVLTVLAALGTGALFVAVARERRRSAAPRRAAGTPRRG